MLLPPSRCCQEVPSWQLEYSLSSTPDLLGHALAVADAVEGHAEERGRGEAGEPQIPRPLGVAEIPDGLSPFLGGEQEGRATRLACWLRHAGRRWTVEIRRRQGKGQGEGLPHDLPKRRFYRELLRFPGTHPRALTLLTLERTPSTPR